MKKLIFILFLISISFWLYQKENITFFQKQSKQNSGYKIKKNEVYYDDIKLKNVDIDTFEIFESCYAKDKNNIFEGHINFKDADLYFDAPSFKAFNCYYTLDKNGAYYRLNKKISQADINTFESLNEVFAKDKNNIYFKWHLIKDVDYSSFKIIEKRFAKDKNQIFYIKELSYEFNKNKFYNKKYLKIKNMADVNTFEIINNLNYCTYTKDKNNIYYIEPNSLAKVLENYDSKILNIIKNIKQCDDYKVNEILKKAGVKKLFKK